MNRALHLIKNNQHKINLFVEVRDARVPISSRNDEFDKIIRQYNKQKLIIFNKYDLCDQQKLNELIRNYNKVGIDCFPTSAINRLNLINLLNFVKDKQKFKSVGTWIMISGMPNVGKSTIINQIKQVVPNLSNKKAFSHVKNQVATTKKVYPIRISDDPLCYLLDSPGVMIPNITDNQVALKLSLIGCIKEVIPSKELITDYLFYVLKNGNNNLYYKKYGISKPINSKEWFYSIRDKYKHYQYQDTQDYILEDFRTGKLGNFLLDEQDFEIN